jgi:signal-transduction protein with cAMP-binding, CBS, and nucleotidyltransferase domain
MTNPVPPSDDFQDPLEDYEPREYSDALEQALVEEELGAIRHEPFSEIAPTTPVHEAVKNLASHHIACLLVTEKNKLVGVFSERDVLSKVVLEYDKVKDLPVSEVMTTEPIYVNETDSAVVALSVMALCGYRHVPVVDLNDNVVGIVSPQRVTEFLQKHFNQAS